MAKKEEGSSKLQLNAKKAADAAIKSSSGGKQKKKKWSKGKTKDKLNNAVLFSRAIYDKMMKEVPGYKLITPAVLSERMKITGSLARAALKKLAADGVISVVAKHHAQGIYTKPSA